MLTAYDMYLERKRIEKSSRIKLGMEYVNKVGAQQSLQAEVKKEELYEGKEREMMLTLNPAKVVIKVSISNTEKIYSRQSSGK